MVEPSEPEPPVVTVTGAAEPATGPSAAGGLLIRDAHGALVAVTTARQAVRDALNHSTPEVLEVNARGELHPSQMPLLEDHWRSQLGPWRTYVATLLGSTVVGAVIVAPGIRPASVALAVSACLLAAESTLFWMVPRPKALQVKRFWLRQGSTPRRHGSPLPATAYVPGLDDRWLGVPVVAHCLPVTGSGWTPILSGDLDLAALGPAVVQPQPPRPGRELDQSDRRGGPDPLQGGGQRGDRAADQPLQRGR